jgi:hypothetical protein
MEVGRRRVDVPPNPRGTRRRPFVQVELADGYSPVPTPVPPRLGPTFPGARGSNPPRDRDPGLAAVWLSLPLEYLSRSMKKEGAMTVCPVCSSQSHSIPILGQGVAPVHWAASFARNFAMRSINPTGTGSDSGKRIVPLFTLYGASSSLNASTR